MITVTMENNLAEVHTQLGAGLCDHKPQQIGLQVI